MLHEKRLAGHRAAVIGAAVIMTTVICTFVATRLYATYATATQVGILEQRQDAFEMAQATKLSAITDLLMELGQTVWAPPETEKRRPSTVEVWQLNRDKDIRDRLLSLEMRMYRLEAQHEKTMRVLEEVAAKVVPPAP